jgi:hypothetical protein
MKLIKLGNGYLKAHIGSVYNRFDGKQYPVTVFGIDEEEIRLRLKVLNRKR